MCVKKSLVPYEEKLMNKSSFQETASLHDCLWVNSLPERMNAILGDNLIATFYLSLSLNTKWYSRGFNIVFI